MDMIAVNGVNIGFEISGAGEPVMLIGGTGMPPAGWDAAGLRPALVHGGYQVVAFAARGVAPSGAPAPPYTVEDLCLDVAGLLDHLGQSQCRVVGLSLGGFVTEVLARTRPDLVRAAVLIASAGPPTAMTRLMLRAQRDVAAAGPVPVSSTTYDDVRAALPPDVLRDDDAQVERWSQMLAFDTWTSSAGQSGQYTAAWSWLEDDQRMDRLAQITVPCLVVAFEHDLQFPPRCGRQAAAAIPRGEFIEVPSAAHGGLFTHPDVCCEILLSYINRS